MVVVRPIPAGVEVFNTYGAHLGNAALLARYGFLLDSCENDVLTFGWPGSGKIITDDDWDGLVEVCQGVKRDIGPLVDVSSSLYQPDDGGRGLGLSINSDGVASLDLFIWHAKEVALQELSSSHQELGQTATQEFISGLIIRTFSVLLQVEIRTNVDHGMGADPITDVVVSTPVIFPSSTLYSC